MLGINNNPKIRPAKRKNATKSGSYALEEDSLFGTKMDRASINSIKKEFRNYLDEDVEGDLREATQERKKQTKNLLKKIADTLSQAQ